MNLKFYLLMRPPQCFMGLRLQKILNIQQKKSASYLKADTFCTMTFYGTVAGGYRIAEIDMVDSRHSIQPPANAIWKKIDNIGEFNFKTKIPYPSPKNVMFILLL